MQRRSVWVELRERELERGEKDFHSVLEFESYDFTLQIVSETSGTPQWAPTIENPNRSK